MFSDGGLCADRKYRLICEECPVGLWSWTLRVAYEPLVHDPIIGLAHDLEPRIVLPEMFHRMTDAMDPTHLVAIEAWAEKRYAMEAKHGFYGAVRQVDDAVFLSIKKGVERAHFPIQSSLWYRAQELERKLDQAEDEIRALKARIAEYDKFGVVEYDQYVKRLAEEYTSVISPY